MDKKLRILIVDDNPHARGALSAYLSMREGMTMISEASNGAEALKKIEEQGPDVVLMDVKMPVMDGLEATQIIKERWPRIRVIILTIYPEHRTQARQAGADAFLLKGCPMEEMTSLISSLN